ncbi:hypothetical protein MMC18_002780 [Xylographa bjoerkii]|nr:hypothetical protein [Xylographa bjoerkii]
MDPLSLIAAFGAISGITPKSVRGIKQFIAQFRVYYRIYGTPGLLLPFLCSSDVWSQVKDVLQTANDEELANFKASLVGQANMTAVTGAIMAQVAITGLSLANLSQTHWVARVFFLGSLLSGCASVYYAMVQMRLLGPLTSEEKVHKWLLAPAESIKCRDKRQPSVRAVLIIDTPKWLVGMAAITFVIGLSIYIVFVYVNNVDPLAGPKDDRNILIAYFCLFPICGFLYLKAELFEYYVNQNIIRLFLVDFVTYLFRGQRNEGERYDSHRPAHWFSTGTSHQSPTHDMDQVNLPPAAHIRTPTKFFVLQPPTINTPSHAQLVDMLSQAVVAHRQCAEADEQLAMAFERYMRVTRV